MDLVHLTNLHSFQGYVLASHITNNNISAAYPRGGQSVAKQDKAKGASQTRVLQKFRVL